MKAICLVAMVAAVLVGEARSQEAPAAPQIAAELRSLSNQLGGIDPEPSRTMLGRRLRQQIESANRASSAEWENIHSRADWESFRHKKLEALRKSLGNMPPPPQTPLTFVTGHLPGDGFEIRKVVFQSRPGLVVTANLYVPDPPRAAMPGLLLSHCHHNPKEQGELQDMGMTWARAGCYVLVPDHLGHGERRQHLFVSAADYPAPFQLGRQDYYFRYDTSLQLYLTGDSLLGWMAHDLMTCVSLLLTQPGIDSKRICILGSVAGGGDPAALAAALDERITCVCPFNFGGPQPETPYPLPDDAETRFNYAGAGSWESTRNLYRSARDGFLPWVIVGSIAPRYLIHAHEFAWDEQRDPVWKRYQRLWSFYDAADRLGVAHGHGTLTGQNPPGSHCNNIGSVHRRQIHELLRRWLDIDTRPEQEYSQRREASELTCLTPEAKSRFQPQPLHRIVDEQATEKMTAVRKARAAASPQEQRQLIRESWSRVLGMVHPPQPLNVRAGSPMNEQATTVAIRQEVLETESNIFVRAVTLALNSQNNEQKPRKLLISIVDDGVNGLLRRRSEQISKRLQSGWTVVIAEVRGTGQSRPNNDLGPQSELTRHSATSLMLGEPLLAGQLRDLRAVWQHVKKTIDRPLAEVAVLGDSDAEGLPVDEPFAHPHRVNSRPAECHPTGMLLALLFALFEDDVNSVEAYGGLVSYQSMLESPFVQVPHACIVPGVLREVDLPDVVAALAPRRVQLFQLVDGRGRRIDLSTAHDAYETARQAYRVAGVEERFELSVSANGD